MRTQRTNKAVRLAIAAAIVAALATWAGATQTVEHEPRTYDPDIRISETSTLTLCPGAHTCAD